MNFIKQQKALKEKTTHNLLDVMLEERELYYCDEQVFKSLVFPTLFIFFEFILKIKKSQANYVFTKEDFTTIQFSIIGKILNNF